MPDRVVVVGGGAAGLMAAARAAELGSVVLVVEKTGRLGQKVRLTGGGHGNLAHTGSLDDWLGHVGPSAGFVRAAVTRFDGERLRALLLSHGLPTAVEDDGRVFPASRNAHDIVTTLRRYCLAGGAQFRFDSPVEQIIVERGAVRAVRAGGKEIAASAVVLAAGGASYPASGSAGDGYRLARQLGHTVRAPRPGLVPLIVAEPWCRTLEGISLRGVGGSLEGQGRVLARAVGDLVFTAEGMSGPLAFTLSLALAEADVVPPVDLVLRLASPDRDALHGSLAEIGQGGERVTVVGMLRARLPSRLAHAVLELEGIDARARFVSLAPERQEALLRRVRAFRLTLTGTAPLEQAMVTVGGVDRDEIDPGTLASRRVRGLFLAGEVIDMAGDTGGYNLQLAFTTGFIAGESAARWTQQAGRG